ncbi:hypothetical protein TUMSATVNIG1_50130 [Vibrio nigripulchritudo]|uniref:DUF2000 domain-containing protein n=1 Tax=Vibrio nigripulchritudo SOn1 TaxID=1238450 RepID=A0AAV2VLT9_9VIBR|nr:DUF2000 domain-containing protein [Vibrio nigripulchritudo]BCL73040.1 hypothetical protein VNTUMSATTG_49770 [Vibrio nigripulchritudo]BDU34404.1 hypothetical protein TUMSATVNIG1_50130 [Vibrio nigripulchritudo]CCO45451.1 conserved hypothetical protein [Vibrio nigripulchritudo SOn1]
MSGLPNDTQKRFVAVLNKKMETGRALNVLGHLSVALADLLEKGNACYVDYEDKDGNIHPNMSHYPFIVLRADNSNKLRKLREAALENNITFTDFTDTMIEGGSDEQQRRTKDTPESDLNYLGICLFGNSEELHNITKKFSLYK